MAGVAFDAGARGETRALERLDSFPYRHRVRSVMGTPPQYVAVDATIQAAAERMRTLKVGALLVDGGQSGDGQAAGIVSERDILGAIGRDGAAALARPVSSIMSSPVATVPETALLYVAMGRMERMGFRHLAAADQSGRIVGVVSGRALLRLRAGGALALGDAVATAPDAAALKAVQQGLPALARGLLADEVSTIKIASVISQVLRDTTARAAELAEAGMAKDGWGPVPALYALLVLGSGGRGESLLSADQDNAIVHDGGDKADPWFAELGKRVSDTLNIAGIPYCKGGVMASNAKWRRSLEKWNKEVAEWIERAEGMSLLNVDIFYDFRRAWGDTHLTDALRRTVTEAAAISPAFLRLLAQQTEEAGTALDFFGRLRTTEGRVDLKKGGLLPVVAFARVAALRKRVVETSTADRLAAASAAGAIPFHEAERLRKAQETLLRFILEQQIVDNSEGIAPSSRVEVARLSREQRQELKSALKDLEGIPVLLRDVLGA